MVTSVKVPGVTNKAWFAADITHVDVQIGDADILTLATTPYTVLPAPGAGLAYYFWGAYFVTDTSNGAYSQSGDTFIFLNQMLDGSGDVLNDDIENASVHLLTGTPGVNTFGVQQIKGTGVLAVLEDTPLYLLNIDFIGGGNNLTGGGAGNTISIRVFYNIVPTVPFS